jgi:hypothetical protein
MEYAISLLEENTSKTYAPSKVWSSLTKDTTMARKPRMFIWKAIHGGHKVGEWWRHTDCADEFMPCKECDVPIESIGHIILECQVSGQRAAWVATKDLWRRTGRDWPTVTMGLVFGLGLYEVRDGEGTTDRGVTRLFKILVSEMVYLIWQIRNGMEGTAQGPKPKV